MGKLKLLLIAICLVKFIHLGFCQDSIISIDTPEKLYGKLFFDVQNSGIYDFRDSKTFCDVIPKFPINEILRYYDSLDQKQDTLILKEFVLNHFNMPSYESFFSDTSEILNHISKLWDFLTREPDSVRSGTLIPLPGQYIIPGGRFREVYYWDSYFSILGLSVENRAELVKSILNNFSYLIEKYGHIPNGNRTYYLSRSQPPFFSLMIDEYAELMQNDSVYIKYLPFLKEEYEFWMDGYDKLNNNCKEYRHLVQTDDSTVLNRYWDDLEIPRSEAYKEDIRIATEAKSRFNAEEKLVFRNLRAAAESGWDFSSRWFEDGQNLNSIQTINIVPVDLNCLIYKIETTLSHCYALLSNDSSSYFRDKADKRKRAINRYFWNTKYGFYLDYNFATKKQTQIFSLAGIYPLFFNISEKEKAFNVAGRIHSDFLKNGGLITTTNYTGQQWDMPNGWAPLHWITIVGLRNYGITNLAEIIKECWITNVYKVYKDSGKLLEKYDVIDVNRPGGGGEYPNQDGFGWTNGVYEILNK